jgi:hypothetical protein
VTAAEFHLTTDRAQTTVQHAVRGLNNGYAGSGDHQGDFLNADTNEVVTLIIERTGPASALVNYTAKEATGFNGATGSFPAGTYAPSMSTRRFPAAAQHDNNDELVPTITPNTR